MWFARRHNIFWSVLLLLMAGCATSPIQQSPTHASPTPIPTFLSTSTNTPLPFLPNDHDPFQATFVERAPGAPCPASPRPTDICFNVYGSGRSIPYGPITFTSFDINYLVPGQPSFSNNQIPNCEPTTRQGKITIGKDTIMFMASGTWCVSEVQFAYQVTGGTGKFRHAHGKGSISIPNPLNQVLEYWTGTLTP